jgi:DNA primase
MFEAVLLPEAEKRDLCISLLEEFGAQQITETRKGELIHSCLLPFGMHSNGDANPSASLNFNKLTYKCLGCRNGGGIMWFIGTMQGTGVKEAKAWLNKTAGLGQVMDLSKLNQYFDALYEPKAKPTPPPVYSPHILRPWLKIHPYLTEHRQIPEENIIHFKAGFAEDYQIFPPNEEKGLPAVYTDCIILPHFLGESLTGWQARRLDGEKPKYKSSPDFPKDTTLFNYDYMRQVAIVVESPMSVIRHWHHMPDLEATFGASITNEQLKLISKHPKIILAFDNDKAGWSATEEVGAILTRYCNVYVVDHPYRADLADLSDDDADYYVEQAVPYAIWSPPAELLCYACKERECRC